MGSRPGNARRQQDHRDDRRTSGGRVGRNDFRMRRETTMTIEFRAIEFDSADEAIQHYYASGYGDRVISLQNRFYVTSKAEAERLAAAGVAFAYLFDHDLPDGRNI